MNERIRELEQGGMRIGQELKILSFGKGRSVAMNERIKELAEHSEITQYVAAHNKYLERFAELIVSECATYIEEDQGSGFELANRLREHFGVEP